MIFFFLVGKEVGAKICWFFLSNDAAEHSDIWKLATSMEIHKSEIENWEFGAGIYISFYSLRSSLQENYEGSELVCTPNLFFCSILTLQMSFKSETLGHLNSLQVLMHLAYFNSWSRYNYIAGLTWKQKCCLWGISWSTKWIIGSLGWQITSWGKVCRILDCDISILKYYLLFDSALFHDLLRIKCSIS